MQVVDEHLAEGADGQAVFLRLQSRSVNVQRRVIFIERLRTGIGDRIQLPAVNLLYQTEDALIQPVVHIVIGAFTHFIANQRLIVIFENVELFHVVGDEPHKMAADVDIIGAQFLLHGGRLFVLPVQRGQDGIDGVFVSGVEVQRFILLSSVNVQATEGLGERPSAIFG